MQLTTDRLTLRPTTLADAPFMLRLLNSPSWIEFIGDRNVHTIGATENYLCSRLVGKCKGIGTGMYTVLRQKDNMPVGTCTLIQRDYLDNADIGYALLPEYEGNGYAFEATKALLDYATNELNYQKLVAITLTNHQGSIRLLKKLGFLLEKRFEEGGEELFLFALERGE
jgi:[ribosomal protein S5]-alanine N-acetyltransferase